MRSPELQLIDKLEEMKQQLAEKQSAQTLDSHFHPELAERLIAVIDTAQLKFRALILENRYDENLTPLAHIVEQQNQLLPPLEKYVQAITILKQELQPPSSDADQQMAAHIFN